MDAPPRVAYGCLLVCVCLFAAGCTDKSRVIAPLSPDVGDDVVRDVSRWLTWPTQDYIDMHRARTDRSGEFPSVYPETDIADPKPTRPGAKSPDAAKREAGRWTRGVLRDRWIPEDLDDTLIPLQLDPPSRSAVICRFRVDDSLCQIAQTRTAVCVVIRPSRSVVQAGSPPELGPPVFREFFTKGSDMAAVPAQAVPVSSPEIHLFVPDHEQPWPIDARESWWGWRLWYTDGEAVAVFLVKQVYPSQRVLARPFDDPWF